MSETTYSQETNDYQPRKFSRSQIQQAHSINLSDYYANRREICGITIDSVTTVDRDDGIWLLKKENGNFELQVSIADVSTIIPKNSPIDEEAIKRVCTLYHTMSVSPMLPSKISKNLGSLEENKLRLALTLFLEIELDGKIKSSKIEETLFKNLKAFNYEEVESILVQKSDKPEHQILLEMQTLAKIISVNRGGKSGILTEFGYLDEDGNLIQENINTHQLIAEFMILTNRIVAEMLAENKLEALYRVQDVGIDDLKLAMKLKGHKLISAKYAQICQPHVALGLASYCHFTSPLRRLPDLINHRIIKRFINKKPLPYTSTELMLISTHINTFIEQERAEKNLYLERKRDREKTQKFSIIEEIDFESLDLSEFSLLIEYAAENNLLPDISSEIEKRINDLQPKDFYYIWLIGKFNNFFDLDDINAVSILLIKSQIENSVIEYKSEYCEVRKKFFFFCYVDGLTSPDAVEEDKKSKAKQKSSLAWIKAYLEDELTDNPNPIPQYEAQQINQLNSVQNSDLTTEDNTNWIAFINNYCQLNRLDYPTYSFSEADGHFVCEVSLQLEGEILSAQNYGKRKKEAKMKAAFTIVNKYKNFFET